MKLKNIRIICILLIFCYNVNICLSQNIINEKYNTPLYQKIKRDVQNKNIVALGEFEHGWENIIEAKCDVAKFLIDELGFRNIVFEGSFIDGFIEEQKEYDSKTWIQNTQFDAWNSINVEQLITHFKTKYPNSTYYGCDIQDLPTQQFIYFLSDALKPVSKQLSKQVLKKDSICSYLFVQINFKKQKEASDIELFYNNLLDTIQNNKSKFIITDKEYNTMQQCIKNRIWLCKGLQANSISEFFRIRDYYNSMNLEWIFSNIDKNTKTIIWAADGHIDKSLGYNDSMIEVLTKERKSQIFSISFKNTLFKKYEYNDKFTYRKKINNSSFDGAIRVTNKKRLIIK